ncbi:MAG: sigma-70 family RNA polymerase sigma factor [Verrucomicrobiota bacterium]|nr:sigma-70 family RNA polymerase sigma factor [Verrucomicrobiota bacterium]
MLTEEQIVRHFAQMRASLLGYLRLLVRDPHMAEDLLQDTWVVVLKKKRFFDENMDFGAWIRGIARNLARNALRKKQPSYMPLPELAEAIDNAYAAGSKAETEQEAIKLEHLRACIDKLSPGNLSLLRLRFQNAERLREIAERIGRSVGAVQVALSRVRMTLLRCIEEYGKHRESQHGLGIS